MWVIDARMDDLTVTRACVRANAVLRLDDNHLAARLRERSSYGEPDDSGADDDDVNLIH